MKKRSEASVQHCRIIIIANLMRKFYYNKCKLSWLSMLHKIHSCQFSLVSCSWAHQFQTGGTCIPSSARHCTSILVWPSSPRCWLAVSSSSTVGDFQPIWCPPVASRNCRRPFICLCWAKALEQSSWWHYIGFIAVSFQKETENSLISSILSGRYFIVCYGFLSPSWFLKLIVT